MRRLISIPLALTGLALAPTVAQAANGFSLGVAAGDVSQASAIVWARADVLGPGVVEVRTNDRFHRCPVGDPALRRAQREEARRAKRSDQARNRLHRVFVKRETDRTVQEKVGGLRAGTRYLYRFCLRKGRMSDVGTFSTSPKPTSPEAIYFAISGDMDAQPKPGTSGPFWNGFEVLDRMRTERNDFNIVLGDTIYSDSEVPGIHSGDALSVEQKWTKYRRTLAESSYSRLRGSAPTYLHWDDHEFYNDFSRFESEFETGAGNDTRSISFPGQALYNNGHKAFTDYNPVTYSPDYGIYRRVRWGKNLELFFLDERSFRSAKADANHVCDNPATGEPDLAPTSEGTLIRSEFGLLISSLRQPVSAQCKAAINDPNRTMLGRKQLGRLKGELRASTATFKVIVNEVPIQQYYALPYDRWEGYESERQELADFVRKNVSNAIFLTTDIHANLVNDVRLRTLEPGGPQNTGVMEVTTGPVATKSYLKEINDTVGNAAVGDGVYTLGFKPPPPQGVGMQCAALDVFSYAEVQVTRNTLKVYMRDANGQPVRESLLGLPTATCPPVTLQAAG